MAEDAEAVKTSSGVGDEVDKLVSVLESHAHKMAEQDKHCQTFERHVESLQKLSRGFKELHETELPQSCSDCIVRFHDSLDISMEICNTLEDREKPLAAEERRTELENLDRELKRAQENLQVALTRVKYVQSKKHVKNTEESVASGPKKIEKPKVTQMHGEDLMVVAWNDTVNPREEISHYEICYDCETGDVVSAQPHESSCKLNVLKISLGCVYTVQVRACNGAGPGEWSDPVLFRFYQGRPNRPRWLEVGLRLSTEAIVVAKRPSEEDENGSPVTHCIVEYRESNAETPIGWTSLKHPFEESSTKELEISVKNLERDTAYSFRLKMVNAFGESGATEKLDLTTHKPVPCGPSYVHFSLKRGANFLKLRWWPPVYHPHSVAKYEVQIRKAKSQSDSDWEDLPVRGNKKSVKATGLKSDTKYSFRVRAITHEGEIGEYSEEKQGETLYGPLGQFLCTTGAFFGGTLGGPLTGAAGFGIGAAINAFEHFYEDSPQILTAGAAGCIGGAILGTVCPSAVGIASAITVYRHVSGATSANLSPQTSDNEGEN